MRLPALALAVARFDRLARSYDRVVPFRTRDALAAALRLGPGDIVMDMGGGTGRVGAALAGHGRRWIVVDPSRGMLAQARRLRRPVDPVRGLGERLPLRDRTVDRVLMVDALHHVQDVDRVLAEVRRVLRPDGRAVVEEFRTDRWWVRWGVTLLERLFLFRSRFPQPAKMRARFERAGFRVETRPASWKDLHYVLVPRGAPGAQAAPRPRPG